MFYYYLSFSTIHNITNLQFAAFTAEQIELMNNLHAECISKTGATEGKKGPFLFEFRILSTYRCLHIFLIYIF